MGKIIEVKNLSRTYTIKKGFLKKDSKKIIALDNINFSISKGEIFGLIGPNGAGKTTTIKILTTLLAPNSGEATIFGYKTFGEEKKIRSRINFIFGDERSLYWRLSAKDNLSYFADLYKINAKIKKERIPFLLELVGLSERANDKVETYSKGMRQRLQIARGLINDPEIIFLDEPTTGLDPVAANELRSLVKEMKTQGKTILLTTHYMFEADELCDRIAIIKNGKIIALDNPENLKEQFSSFEILEAYFTNTQKETLKVIESYEGVYNIEIKEIDKFLAVIIQCHNAIAIIQNIEKQFSKENIIRVNRRTPTLEDVYIKLIKG